MKKIIILPFVLAATVWVTGCSVSIDEGSSKADRISDKADILSNEISETMETLVKMERTKPLTSEEQELIVNNIDKISIAIDEFEEEEAPFLAERAKKLAVKLLSEKEKELLMIQEKAKMRNANKEDVIQLIEILSSDLEFKLY